MQTTLVDSLVQRVKTAIDERQYKAGNKLPSVRAAAGLWGVSNFTVVQAYDRLVAQGWIESRKGSGFYVQQRQAAHAITPVCATSYSETPTPTMDVTWLIRNMFREVSAHAMPASGTVPAAWLDDALVAQATRAIARDPQMNWLPYGTPQGWLPLREQLAVLLAGYDIQAHAGQILTTAGATQGFTLVTRALSRPGDVILIDAPAWFVLYATLAGFQRQVIGVPRTADGPDLAELERLATLHKPKMYVTQSVLHNPTSGSLSAAKAFNVLRIAEKHNFYIVEDDVYADLHPGSHIQSATRLASLDQLKRVIYISGFSKTLAANLRVGYIAADEALIPMLTDHKMLAALTTPEFGERIIHKVLCEGQYRKHLERLRSKLEHRRPSAIRGLEAAGVRFPDAQPCGLFAWGELGKDASVIANHMLSKGFIMAPGALFHPDQAPSTRMRFNLATSSHPEMLKVLESVLKHSTPL